MKGVASYDDYLGRDTDSGRFFHPKKVSPLFLPRNHPQSENLERYHINRIEFNLIVSIATAIHWNLHKYTIFYIFFFLNCCLRPVSPHDLIRDFILISLLPNQKRISGRWPQPEKEREVPKRVERNAMCFCYLESS